MSLKRPSIPIGNIDIINMSLKRPSISTATQNLDTIPHKNKNSFAILNIKSLFNLLQLISQNDTYRITTVFFNISSFAKI